MLSKVVTNPSLSRLYLRIHSQSDSSPGFSLAPLRSYFPEEFHITRGISSPTFPPSQSRGNYSCDELESLLGDDSVCPPFTLEQMNRIVEYMTGQGLQFGNT